MRCDESAVAKIESINLLITEDKRLESMNSQVVEGTTNQNRIENIMTEEEIQGPCEPPDLAS